MTTSANTLNIDTTLEVIRQVAAVLDIHGSTFEIAVAACGAVMFAGLAVSFALVLARKL